MAKVDFSAFGAEAFVPPTTTKNIAGFIYEEMRHDAWKFSLGARIENSKIDAEEFIGAGLPADSVSFTPWSGAFGTVYSFDKEWSLGANVQYTQRAPSSQELFADGPHIATNQFEVGNRALNKVTSTSIDLTLKRQGEFFTGAVGAFYSNFSNFVGLFPTDIFRNPEDRSVAPGPEPYIDPNTGGEVEPIQQFNYAQVRARFYGFEAQLGFAVWKQGVNLVSIKLQADYVRATDRSNGQPLPFIPPLRVGTSFTYEREALTATLGALFASSQNRTPQFQTMTPGYANLFLNASYRFMSGAASELEVFVQGTNLLDETIRYSTSSLKDIAPAGGRAVMAGMRGSF